MNSRLLVGIFATLFFLLMPVISVQGQEGPGNSAALNPDELNDASEPIAAGDLVQEKFDQFLEKQKRPTTYGTTDSTGKVFYTGRAPVSVGPDNPSWGKARTIAFEKALLNGQAEFVKDMYGKSIVEQAKTLFRDDSSGARDFPEHMATASKLKAIADKLVTLADTQLNVKLEELGIDPQEYSAKPPSQKKQLVEETLLKTSITRAIGDMTGLIPVQTFEGSDGTGHYVIGVVVMYSPKLKQLAHDIDKGRRPLLTGKPKKPLKQIVPTLPEELVNEFGIRILFDEKGDPCVVSYGQWSHNYTGNNARTRERHRESAAHQSRELADSYITIFQAGKMFREDKGTTGEIIQNIVEKDSDGNISERDITNFIDEINQEIKVRAKGDMAGRGTYKKWRYKHPNGHEISGVIRVWTMAQLGTAKDVRNWKPETRAPKTATQQGTARANSPAGLKESRDDMDLDDF